MMYKSAKQSLLDSYNSRGFFKSFEKRTPIKFDNPFPLLTHPFLDWLISWELKELTYLEIGSGGSTIFFQKYFKKITSVEPSLEYFNELKSKLTDNVEYRHISISDVEDGNYHVENYYDFCLIDFNLNRYSCVSNLLKKSKFSFIIFDNTEHYPNTSEFIRNNGYTTQIDFWGFKNSQNLESSTSIFINDNINLKLKKVNRFPAPESYKLYEYNQYDHEKIYSEKTEL